MNAFLADRRVRRVAYVSAVSLIASCTLASFTAAPVSAARPVDAAPRSLHSKTVGATPRSILGNTALQVRHHDAAAVLSLNVGLTVRHSSALDAVIAGASTPGSPSYGHYLTPEQYQASFAPTDADVASVRRWLTDQGARVTGVSPDNLIVSAQATTAIAEHAFRVSIGDYRDARRAFYANDVAPSVPADSSIRWVTGLDDFAVARSFATPSLVRGGGYYPSDFRSGYNVGTAATGQTIGLTLWGAPLDQADLHNFALHTASPEVVKGQAGADGVDFIPCSVSSCNPAGAQSGDTTAWVETALDVESAHGVAPGSHLKYWLAGTSQTHPLIQALEHAMSAAANDPSLTVVSNSWGIDDDVVDPNMETSLQHAAAVGKTFFFSSGDSATISYPASSAYVVSVGGTRLGLGSGFAYGSESAWVASGTGCTNRFSRPSWQIGVGDAPSCSGRAEPDVAADADPNTGAYVVVGGQSGAIGGTSLSAPLWAGMTAVWNADNISKAKPVIGFAPPILYSFGNNTSVYHSVFHDVTTGHAGASPAGSGWDQATGWGSPNLGAMIAMYQHLTATTATLSSAKNPTPLGSSVVYTATVTPTPAGGTVTFRQGAAAISGCVSIAVSAGKAHCTASYGQSGTYRVQAGYSGTADYAGDASNLVFETVSPAPAPPAGYWMVGATGAVYGFGTATWRGNAATSGVTHFEPIPSRRGYWIVNSAGRVFSFGEAHALGSAGALRPGESVSSLSSTPSGNGYWLFTSKGRALTFGDAHFYGDMSATTLNRPVVGSVATPSGHGYFMVASDGGIFSFGDAGFFGSTGGMRLNRPVNGLVPTATNRGYWLVASDGGIFAFGDADFHGSMGGTALNKPIVGMVRYGDGYLMVGSDGGIFDFSNKPFLGSLAGKSLPAPIVSVAS
jgi:kumamolisin